MESVKGALKSGLTSPEGFWENMGSSPVVQNGAVSEDDFFFVDDLLDFSKAEQVEDDEEKAFVTENDTVHLSATKLDNFNSPPPVALHENELCLPADELADLEWLSNFVDDSTPSYSLTLPAQKPPPPPVKYVETKARTGVRVWPLSESSTSSSSTSHTSPFVDLTHSADSFIEEPAAKKQKKQYAAERRCSHCLVYKTPQWRAGPLGAKTLCNACGVRYKSGRLLPEYRPACSPTFSIEKHSNNHRKVMEMRRKKEEDDASGGFEKADRRLRIFGVNLF